MEALTSQVISSQVPRKGFVYKYEVWLRVQPFVHDIVRIFVPIESCVNISHLLQI